MINTEFIDDLNTFMNIIMMALGDSGAKIYISSAFDNIIYKKIFDEVLNNRNIENCNIIIPYVASSGILSRSYINKLSNRGGKVRINSQFRKNIILIGDSVFIPSFSAKYNRNDGIKFQFEHCIKTKESQIIESVKNSFSTKWEESVPIMY